METVEIDIIASPEQEEDSSQENNVQNPLSQEEPLQETLAQEALSQESPSTNVLSPTLDASSESSETEPSASEASLATSAALAVVHGESVLELPKDLYIPPEALEVFLDAFEGPLDLLLYLIKRQNLDILDIPIAEITKQYMQYVELMQELQFELAAEYLLMAAMLAEIKSRMLLPRPEELEDDEDDPRAELIRRLQEYERFKTAAISIDALPREGREIFDAVVSAPDVDIDRPQPNVELKELLLAFKDVMQRAKLVEHHHVSREKLTVNERMTSILDYLQERGFAAFTQLINIEEGRQGVVVSFLAILELLKQSLIDLIQEEPFSPIHIKVRS